MCNLAGDVGRSSFVRYGIYGCVEYGCSSHGLEGMSPQAGSGWVGVLGGSGPLGEVDGCPHPKQATVRESSPPGGAVGLSLKPHDQLSHRV